MKIVFDLAKSERNARERGLPVDRVEAFNWETARYADDTRRAYPERRIVGLGFIGTRLHVVCFTPIEGGIRVISFRKANDREVRRYEKEETTDG
jgi:uncharacterized DUF497 family protein